MGGRIKLLPWERYEVWDCRIEGSGGCQAQNRHDCSHTIHDNIGRAYADFWDQPRAIANAASAFSTRKYSDEAGFGETTVRQIDTSSLARRCSWFDINLGCEACWTCKILPLQRASLTNYTMEIRYGWRYGDGSPIAGGIDIQIGNFDDLSLVNAICVPILLHVSIFLISVTKLWDMIFHQWVCKGRMGHAKVLDCTSGWLAASKLDIDLPVTVTLQRISYPMDRNFGTPSPFGHGKQLPTCKYLAMQPQLCGCGLGAL